MKRAHFAYCQCFSCRSMCASEPKAGLNRAIEREKPMVKVMKLKQGVYFNDDTGDRVRGRVELQGTISGLYVIRGPRDRLYVRSESNLKRIKPKKKAPSRPVRKVKAKKKAAKKRR